MAKIIGIDLGTTNSLAAVWMNGESRLIPNALGNYLTPSVVSVGEDGTVYVGEVARERLLTHPQRTVSVFKRSMGTDRTYLIGSKSYKPEELSALVLRRLKEDAERFLGEPVEEAVVSVPAYFGDMARRATRDAGRLAGLKVERIVNEPSAAALAAQQMKKQDNARMLIYDLGGGTLDVSLVRCFDNVVEIDAVSGDTRLGGSDFDRLIAEAFCKANGMRFSQQTRGIQEALLRCAEQAKKQLSMLERVSLDLTTPELHGSMELSQRELVGLSRDLLVRLSAPINTVLRDSGVRPEQLTRVVLVGGSTKMPLIQQYIRYVMKHVPVVTANPDYMVALGAGIYAGIKERDEGVRDLVMTDICPFSLGTEVHNETDKSRPLMSVIIPRNTALPTSREQMYCNTSDGQTTSVIGIYQGEEMYARENVRLGQVKVHYPRAKAGEVSFKVRFTYDINGLLLVRVEVSSTGEVRELAFMSGKEVDLNDSDIQQRRAELEKLQVSARDQEENRLLLAQGERLYTQVGPLERELLKGCLQRFEAALAAQKPAEIAEARDKLESLIGQMAQRWRDALDGSDEDFLRWLDQDGEEDDLATDWTKIY